MDSRVRYSGWLRPVVAGFLVGLSAHWRGDAVQAAGPDRFAAAEASACGVLDVRSSHFLVHTDLSTAEADKLVERLEFMLRIVSDYWGRPMRGVIECYVVRDLSAFPQAGMDPMGISAIRSPGGVTLVRTETNGKRFLTKSVVYANDRPEVAQHEAVHAYCHSTFGRTGPVWYSEGMAEMGHYWAEGDTAVCADPREIRYLREHAPKSLADTLSPLQISGDSWQNYAARWALCHFLVHNPNYSRRFWLLGRGLLAGKEVTFEEMYGAMDRELWFEYRLFLEHIALGYRVDLCAWDWKKKFACLPPASVRATTVLAGRGWQPSGVTVLPGTRYEYIATGDWQIAEGAEPVDADGDSRGCGRLVGVLMKDYRLGPEFELGAAGSLELPAGGDLYLRCRNDWNEFPNHCGCVTVKLTLQGQDQELCRQQPSSQAGGEP